MELSANAEEANASVQEAATNSEQVARNSDAVSQNTEQSDAGVRQVLQCDGGPFSDCRRSLTKSRISISGSHRNPPVLSQEGSELCQKGRREEWG